MIDLKDLTYEQLEEFLKELGEPKFRTEQIFSWLSRGAVSFEEMTNLSKKTREKLVLHSRISSLCIKEKFVSRLDGAVKYLFELEDGNCIETVAMEYEHGLSLCISSQVGCRMGCGFCASTIGGLYRNLTAGELLNQVIFAQKDLERRVGNIVMMGIGEPLDNFKNVLTFLKNVNHPKGLNIGYRRISLSTCGLVPKIDALGEENLPITLCISLHGPDNETRGAMMPVNRSYPVEELMAACRRYLKKTGRRITFEYSLVRGVNDGKHQAEKLAALLKGMLCHVNLIPVNKVEERSYEKSGNQAVRDFQNILTQRGINATVRRELGSDISASCGQLRKKTLKKTE